MGSFKLWMEENLRREQQAEVQRIYDLAVKTLLGAAKDQTQLSLSDIEDDGSAGKPPSGKGPQVVFNKLNHAQVFQKLKALGNADLATRADKAQQYLNSSGNSGQVGPKKTVGQLLMMMFGDDALDTYGRHKWKISTPSQPQAPENQAQAGQNALAPPMAQQAPTAPQSQAQPPATPQADPSMGMAPPPGPGSMPPMGPPQPGAPLPSPGGPMPPRRPVG